jgi:HTH-type transcriptional regulator/antitoxin HigA
MSQLEFTSRVRRFESSPAILNAAHHKRMLGLLDLLMQASEGKPRHPAVPLIGIVARLIEDWESDRLPLAPQHGRDALRYLMNARGLKQSDLREARGLKPPPPQSLHTHRRPGRDPVAR